MLVGMIPWIFLLGAGDVGFALAESEPANSGRLKVTFDPGDSWLFLDEILVNPEAKPQASVKGMVERFKK